MAAIFGGAVKKPLMTKVSMRHLNEIVRERNQYSRDALEAWQDFINLKGRMDTELGKVTKRNNFLVEELESWKQQVSVSWLGIVGGILIMYSSSNSKHLLSNSPRRRKISRSRSRITSVKTDGSQVSLINRRMMLPVSPLGYQGPRSNVTMLSRLWFSSKKLPRNLNVNGSATRRNCPPCNTPMSRFFVNVMRLNALCYTCAR
jgi:hypothetical protein